MSRILKVLVVEDGHEYSELLARFGAPDMVYTRAGDGAEALAALRSGGVDLLFLDMRFDRIEAHRLLGDMAQTTDRFNGDPVRARAFLEENQGAYILSAIREAGHPTPAVFSHDFDDEPKRWMNLSKRYAPVSYLPDNASPSRILEILRAAVR